jgi:hypothetical protein
MTDRERDFLRYYDAHRVEDQISYYRSKSGWHGRRAQALVILAGIIMFLSSVAAWAAALGWFGLGAVWHSLATVMPAISAAVVGVRSLYEFDRNHTRFQNTLYDLRHAAAELRPAAGLSGEELREAMGRYVTEVETLLSRENRQWVKLASTAGVSETGEQVGGGEPSPSVTPNQ